MKKDEDLPGLINDLARHVYSEAGQGPEDQKMFDQILDLLIEESMQESEENKEKKDK